MMCTIFPIMRISRALIPCDAAGKKSAKNSNHLIHFCITFNLKAIKRYRHNFYKGKARKIASYFYHFG